jgi:hypothetical protein
MIMASIAGYIFISDIFVGPCIPTDFGGDARIFL